VLQAERTTQSALANLGIGYTSQGRYGEARLAQSLPSLLDTADELKTVAAALGAPAADIHLDRDATETRVKRTPLENYRVVYFATHGRRKPHPDVLRP
jgi:CHAT domain-containing protein